jgi:hypothetical protein
MKNASLGGALSCRAGDVDSNTFTPLGLRIYGKKSNYIVVNKFAFIFPDKKRAERNCINFVYIFRSHRIGKTKKIPTRNPQKKSHVKITDR